MTMELFGILGKGKFTHIASLALFIYLFIIYLFLAFFLCRIITETSERTLEAFFQTSNPIFV